LTIKNDAADRYVGSIPALREGEHPTLHNHNGATTILLYTYLPENASLILKKIRARFEDWYVLALRVF
jgi:hypothetical protein